MRHEVLCDDQVRFYRDNGYLVLPERVPPETMQAVHEEIARFVEEARGLAASNDRLDLEDSHRPEAPRVRRIKLPHKLSPVFDGLLRSDRSEEHTSELQSLMRISYALFCLKKKK